MYANSMALLKGLIYLRESNLQLADHLKFASAAANWPTSYIHHDSPESTEPQLDFKPLDRENYQAVNFWTRKEWETFKDQKKNSGLHCKDGGCGKPKDASQPCHTLAYITNVEGCGVDGYQAMEICGMCCRIWLAIHGKGHAPATWSKADVAAVQFHHKNMYNKHPDLCLCEAHWKVDLLAVEGYPAWSCGCKDVASPMKTSTTNFRGDNSLPTRLGTQQEMSIRLIPTKHS